jgi:hypothetical protein
MKSKFYISISVFIILLFCRIESQQLASIKVRLNTQQYDQYVPVSINLDKITFLSEDSLQLNQIIGDKRIPLPFQLKTEENRKLCWLLYPTGEDNYQFELIRSKKAINKPNIKLEKNNGLLTIRSDQRNLLGYQYGIKYPPAGVDSVYKRSAFIHPVWSPHGQILTRIQPPDHYHHYGIWNPWTKVLFEGDTLDFWNLHARQGTVRFDKFVSLITGPVFGEIQAIHEHVAFKKNGTKQIAMNELQTIRVYYPQNNYYIIDLIINLNCTNDQPVKFLKHRYGGFGWRATEQWNPQNSELLSSEHKSLAEVDNTTGNWFYLQGEVDNEYAGILMMSYPTNIHHPQPMRMWGDPNEKRGLFASFSPTRYKDWLLEPAKSYTLKYRFVVYNGKINLKIAENFWNNYANPPEIEISNIK